MSPPFGFVTFRHFYDKNKNDDFNEKLQKNKTNNFNGIAKLACKSFSLNLRQFKLILLSIILLNIILFVILKIALNFDRTNT